MTRLQITAEQWKKHFDREAQFKTADDGVQTLDIARSLEENIEALYDVKHDIETVITMVKELHAISKLTSYSVSGVQLMIIGSAYGMTISGFGAAKNMFDIASLSVAKTIQSLFESDYV